MFKYIYMYSDGVSSVSRGVYSWDEIEETKKKLEERGIVGTIRVYKVCDETIIGIQRKNIFDKITLRR